MPGMDGLTMLRKLRRNEWGKKVPIVLLSNFSDPAKVATAKKYNVSTKDYLLKAESRMADILRKGQEKVA